MFVRHKTLILVLSVLICQKNNAFCGEQEVFDLTADVMEKYIWRGQNLDNEPVFQTGLSAKLKGLKASIWGNLELTNINGDFWKG